MDNRKVRGAQALATKAVEAAERQHTAASGEFAIANMVLTLAKEVMALNERISETDKLIKGRFRGHELAEVIQSVWTWPLPSARLRFAGLRRTRYVTCWCGGCVIWRSAR